MFLFSQENNQQNKDTNYRTSQYISDAQLKTKYIRNSLKKETVTNHITQLKMGKQLQNTFLKIWHINGHKFSTFLIVRKMQIKIDDASPSPTEVTTLKTIKEDWVRNISCCTSLRAWIAFPGSSEKQTNNNNQRRWHILIIPSLERQRQADS